MELHIIAMFKMLCRMYQCSITIQATTLTVFDILY